MILKARFTVSQKIVKQIYMLDSYHTAARKSLEKEIQKLGCEKEDLKKKNSESERRYRRATFRIVDHMNEVHDKDRMIRALKMRVRDLEAGSEGKPSGNTHSKRHHVD